MNRHLSGILLAAAACGSAAPAAPAADASRVETRPGNAIVTVAAGARAAEPDPFVPDVHPSTVGAARALAEQWGRAAFMSGADAEPVTVRIACSSPDLFRAMSEGLSSVNPAVRAAHGVPESRDARPGRVEVWLSLAVVPSRLASADRAEFSEGAGLLTLKVVAGGDEFELPAASQSARFIEKPWLSDYAGFVADRPAGRWVVGRSHPLRPAVTAAEAARDARASAAEEVLQLVRARVPGHVARDHGRLRAAVEAGLVGGHRLVVDRFPQTFVRGYGNLHREAVLIDASDAKLASLVRELIATADADEPGSRVGMVLSAAALMAVIYALYRFANAFTRGYFTWSLRTAAAIVAAGAVTLLAAVV